MLKVRALRAMSAIGAGWRSMAGARRGVAALEFALIAPVLIIVVLGVVDTTDAIITWRRLTVAAEEIAEIATEMSAQANGSNLITSAQVFQASSAAFAIEPTWKNNGQATQYAITLSSVVYTPTVAGCTTGCSYTAHTAWSVPFRPGLTQVRPCGVLTQVPNGQDNALTLLPVGVAGPSSILVADVAYIFQPIFFTFITGPISMLRSAYLPPRIGTNSQYVVYSPAGTSVTCPGY